MLLERPQFREAFHGAVRDDALDNEADKKLLVFVSTAEADSVCAVRILSVRRSHQQGTIPVIGNSFLSCRRAESWAWRSFVSVAGNVCLVSVLMALLQSEYLMPPSPAKTAARINNVAGLTAHLGCSQDAFAVPECSLGQSGTGVAHSSSSLLICRQSAMWSIFTGPCFQCPAMRRWRPAAGRNSRTKM